MDSSKMFFFEEGENSCPPQQLMDTTLISKMHG